LSLQVIIHSKLFRSVTLKDDVLLEFKHFTGEQLKSFWDRATGRVNGLDKYIFKNKS